MRKISTPRDLLTSFGAGKPESLRRIWLVLLLGMIAILVAVAAVAPRPVWTASQVVLFLSTLLLCSLGALSLGVTEYRHWLARARETLPPTTPGNADPETQPPHNAALPQSDLELHHLLLQVVANQHDRDQRLAGLADTLQTLSANVAAWGATLQAHRQATGEALAAAIGTQGQQTTQLGALQAALEAVAAGVTDITREQTAARCMLQEQGRLLTAADEWIDAAVAEQPSRDEMIGRIAQEVGQIGARQAALDTAVGSREQALNATAAALAAGQSKLADDLQGLHESTRTLAESIAAVASEQRAVCGAVEDNTRILTASVERIQHTLEKMGEHPAPATVPLAVEVPPLAAPQQPRQDPVPADVASPTPVTAEDPLFRLPAAEAVTHGAQLRYEVGPDRDNLGFWANANDWAEWTLEVAQGGRFKVTAEIAAVGGGRFQVLLGEQTLAGTAPNTGDYGRFQQVELGTVELAAPGKTQVAVRPTPDGWQPMNLRALDLTPLPA